MRWLYLLLPELLLLLTDCKRTASKPPLITWSGDSDSLANSSRQLPSSSTSNVSRPSTGTIGTDGSTSHSSFSLFRAGDKTVLEQRQIHFALDPNCNSSELREILVQCIADTPSESKQRINAAIERNLDGSFGIVCAECAFSYLAHTIQFCHHTRNNITCLVFRDAELETDEQEPMP